VAEAADKIAALTGVRRKPTPVRQFLKRLGLAPRKVAAIPAKADVQAQKKFKAQLLEPRLTKPLPDCAQSFLSMRRISFWHPSSAASGASPDCSSKRLPAGNALTCWAL
jgi:hypothetical protein